MAYRTIFRTFSTLIPSRPSAFALLLVAWLLLAMTASSMVLQPRIVGGEDVEPGDFPWMVVLDIANDPEYDDSLTGAGGCGGTHIGEGWILTANHCVNYDIQDNDGEWIEYKRKPELITVKLGDDYTEVGPDSENRHFDVTEIFSHPDNPPNQAQNQHDIALLRIDPDSGNPDLLSDAVPLASPLVDHELSEHDMPARLIGWGHQGHADPANNSPSLQQIDQFIVENQICNDQFGAMTWHEHYICAGLLDEETNAGGYSGDSGGPLLARDEDDNWVQLGVYSFSSLGNPDVHIRVAHHLDWINDVTGLDFDTTPAPSSSDSGSSDSSGAINPLLLLALLGMVVVRFRRGATISAGHK